MMFLSASLSSLREGNVLKTNKIWREIRTEMFLRTDRPAYLWLYSPCESLLLFQLLNLHTVGRTRWTGDQHFATPLVTHKTTHTQNKSTETCMPWVGFEPTIPVFERGKTVNALGRATTVIGTQELYSRFINTNIKYNHINVNFECIKRSTNGLKASHNRYVVIYNTYKPFHRPINVFVICLWLVYRITNAQIKWFIAYS
jgi:hypothetical protein